MSDDLYQEAIIALAKKARELSRLETPDRTATVDNPLCGDRVTIDLDVDGSKVTDVGHRTRGCLLCEAASFLIADHVVGHDVEVLATKASHISEGVGDDAVAMADLWPGLGTLEPVRRFKSRHECVALPFQALIKALENEG